MSRRRAASKRRRTAADGLLWHLPAGPLVLASGSPRRRLLLRQQGLRFRVSPSRVVERFGDETPDHAARRLALAKARAAAKRHPRSWSVAADTVVTIDGELLAKPRSRRESEAMLERLGGRRHAVVTGVAVVGPGFEGVRLCRTAVHLRRLTPAERRAYASTPEPYDKAGGYALQGLGAVLVERIDGDWSNVVGLPLGALRELLAEAAASGPRIRGGRR